MAAIRGVHHQTDVRLSVRQGGQPAVGAAAGVHLTVGLQALDAAHVGDHAHPPGPDHPAVEAERPADHRARPVRPDEQGGGQPAVLPQGAVHRAHFDGRPARGGGDAAHLQAFEHAHTGLSGVLQEGGVQDAPGEAQSAAR